MKCKKYCLLEKPEGFLVIGGMWQAVPGHLKGGVEGLALYISLSCEKIVHVHVLPSCLLGSRRYLQGLMFPEISLFLVY